MAYAQVQTKEVHVNAVGGQTIAVTMTSAYGSGNLAQVWAHDGDQAHATDFPSCADDRGAGNTYTEVTACRINDITNNNKTTGHYAKNIAGSGAPTVTLTWVNTAVTFRSVTVSEFSGLDTASPLIAGSATEVVNTGPGTDDISCAAINFTSQPGALCAYARDDGPGGQEPTKGTGFSDGGSVHDAGSTFYRWEHKRVTVTGNATATFSSGAVTTNYNLMAMGFKEAAGNLSGYVISGARATSRGVGPQVQRFMFRQPSQGVFGGRVIDPPGQIISNAVRVSRFVGPTVYRKRANYYLPWPGATPANAFFFTADPGVYNLTGQSATLLHASVLQATAGAYTLTGKAAILARGLFINAAAGSYTLTGAAATFLLGKFIIASAGAYNITGSTATLLATRALNAVAGAYNITGRSAIVARGYLFLANAGVYNLTGASASLLKGYLLSATAGSYTLSGAAATFATTRVLLASPGAYGVSGAAANLISSLNPTVVGPWYRTIRRRR